MSEEFLFGFDLDALQETNNNQDYIPPAENELKPASTQQSEQAIQFVDARFYKEKPMDIFAHPFGSIGSDDDDNVNYDTNNGDADDEDDEDGPITRSMTGGTNHTNKTSKRNSNLLPINNNYSSNRHRTQRPHFSNNHSSNKNSNNQRSKTGNHPTGTANMSNSQATQLQYSLDLEEMMDDLLDIVDIFGDNNANRNSNNDHDEPHDYNYDNNHNNNSQRSSRSLGTSVVVNIGSEYRHHHNNHNHNNVQRSSKKKSANTSPIVVSAPVSATGTVQIHSLSKSNTGGTGGRISDKYGYYNHNNDNVQSLNECDDELVLSDSEFEDDYSGDDENYFEQSGIGLEEKTLPFDFEKPLRFKPMSTIIVDLEVQQIQMSISRTLYYRKDDDNDNDNDDEQSSNEMDKNKSYTITIDNDDHNNDDSDSSDDTDLDNFHGLDEYDKALAPDPGDLIPQCSYVDECSYDRIFDPEMGMLLRPDSAPPFNKLKRFLSELKPPEYDIVLMESAPLRIYGIDNLKDLKRESLEYLHCALLDQDKLYEKIWQTLLRNAFQVRCCNLNGNISNVKKLDNDGGCHIFQFVGHCCNPVQVALNVEYYRDVNEKQYELNKYYRDLTKHIKSPLNEDYILMECDRGDKKQIIDGEWIPISELRKHFHANLNDIVIVMSPNHEKMAQIFKDMGYSYIVGIKTFDQSNNNTSNNWQILDFLHHFYSAILNQECLQRAFELAKTATKASFLDTQSQKEQKKLVRKVEKLQGMALSESKSEFNDEKDNNDHPTDLNFILWSQENTIQPDPDRFVAFRSLPRGEPIDKLGSMLKHTKYNTNWNNIILKPFIGRSNEVIQLYESLIEHKMIMVGGRENDGRKSIIKRLISWLYEHNYFDDGLFVLDCKSELMHKKPWWKFKDIICFKLSQLGYKVQQNHNKRYNSKKQIHKKKPSTNLDIINEGKHKTPKHADKPQKLIEWNTFDSGNRVFSRGSVYETNSIPTTHYKNNFSIQQPITYMGSISANSYPSSDHLSASKMAGLIPQTPSMKDLMKAIEQYNICFVFFNVDCWDNDEVYHFMDEFATKNKNVRSPCIFTMEYGKHTDYFESRIVNKSKNRSILSLTSHDTDSNTHRTSYQYKLIPTTLGNNPAKSQLVNRNSGESEVVEHHGARPSIIDDLLKGPRFYELQKSRTADADHHRSISKPYKKPRPSSGKSLIRMFDEKHSFFMLHISALNKKDITELFVQLCYFKFQREDVYKHDGIHELFDGKPGNVKRVAAFYQLLCKTQANPDYDINQISLDLIVTKLNTENSDWLIDFHVKYLIFCNQHYFM